MTERDPRFSLEDRLFALVAFKVEGGAFPSKARLIRAGSGYGASVMGVSLPWDGLTPLIGRVTASRGILIRIGHPGCPHPARWVDPSHRTGDRFRGILIRIGHPGCPHPAQWVNPYHGTVPASRGTGGLLGHQGCPDPTG